MATVEEVARGISQVLANTYDGALDEDGNPIKIGLKREQELSITDPRVMDGFGVTLSADVMTIKYQGEVSMKELKDKNFEADTEQMLADILSYIKKQYRKVTGDTLSCSPHGKVQMSAQSTSRVRNWVQASMKYKISGIEGVVSSSDAPTGEELLDKKIKDFIALGKGPKPKNVTRKQEG